MHIPEDAEQLLVFNILHVAKCIYGTGVISRSKALLQGEIVLKCHIHYFVGQLHNENGTYFTAYAYCCIFAERLSARHLILQHALGQ